MWLETPTSHCALSKFWGEHIHTFVSLILNWLAVRTKLKYTTKISSRFVYIIVTKCGTEESLKSRKEMKHCFKYSIFHLMWY